MAGVNDERFSIPARPDDVDELVAEILAPGAHLRRVLAKSLVAPHPSLSAFVDHREGGGRNITPDGTRKPSALDDSRTPVL